jgi:hypothetical protein
MIEGLRQRFQYPPAPLSTKPVLGEDMIVLNFVSRYDDIRQSDILVDDSGSARIPIPC